MLNFNATVEEEGKNMKILNHTGYNCVTVCAEGEVLFQLPKEICNHLPEKVDGTFLLVSENTRVFSARDDLITIRELTFPGQTVILE